MLILLPPSEGKTAPEAGDPLDLASLSFDEQLGARRLRLIEGLEKLSTRNVKGAVKSMGISMGLAGELERNAEIRTAPATRAIELYTGVLYDRLDFGTIGAAGRKRAAENLLIASALWGWLRPEDRIPYYRMPMKARIGRIGGLAAFWRPALDAAIDASGHDRPGEVFLDMRSGSYSTAWRPREAKLVSVRGFTESAGGRKAISHMAKSIRGDVARIVLSQKKMPVEPEQVAAAVEAAGHRVELGEGTLDIIESV